MNILTPISEQVKIVILVFLFILIFIPLIWSGYGYLKMALNKFGINITFRYRLWVSTDSFLHVKNVFFRGLLNFFADLFINILFFAYFLGVLFFISFIAYKIINLI